MNDREKEERNDQDKKMKVLKCAYVKTLYSWIYFLISINLFVFLSAFHSCILLSQFLSVLRPFDDGFPFGNLFFCCCCTESVIDIVCLSIWTWNALIQLFTDPLYFWLYAFDLMSFYLFVSVFRVLFVLLCACISKPWMTETIEF